MFDTILFDLDGTLTDPGEGITNSVAYALKKYGIEVADRRELYKFIGPPLKDSFMKYYGFCEDKAEQAIAYYREYFRDTGIFENRVYGGIEDMLKTLYDDGKKIVLATSKPEGFAVRILEHFELKKYFAVVAGASMDSSRSKKGDVIAYAISLCDGFCRDSAVMIGDREHDIIGAKENGLKSIGVLYGYGDEAELRNAGADYIAITPEDILKLV
ncbi:MAG: HAD family hydrolase [Clostridia bacterium]|nr:HAD family hydrolase [Clostridia bacterium]MBO7319649.1 HAD family hydrolase [Clostridia bacterium]